MTPERGDSGARLVAGDFNGLKLAFFVSTAGSTGEGEILAFLEGFAARIEQTSKNESTKTKQQLVRMLIENFQPECGLAEGRVLLVRRPLYFRIIEASRRPSRWRNDAQ
jgi:hypothetical protein